MSVLTAVLAVPSGYPKWLSVEYRSPLVREDMALVLAGRMPLLERKTPHNDTSSSNTTDFQSIM